MKRRTRITIETAEVMLVRRRANAMGELWCRQCGEQVVMVTPERAAMLAFVSPRAIYRRVERGAIHFVEMPEGSLLICLKSLPIES